MTNYQPVMPLETEALKTPSISTLRPVKRWRVLCLPRPLYMYHHLYLEGAPPSPKKKSDSC